MITRSEPIFAVRDVRASIAFYRDVLGGRSEWLWGDPPSFAGIRVGQVQVMFNQQPELASKIEGHQHHFFTELLDEQHAAHVAAGAPIIEPIANRPWGIREYTVRDPDGYHLRFSGPLKHEKPAGAKDSLPDTIVIEDRLPTLEEYVALKQSVNWDTSADQASTLSHCCAGVVARDGATDRTVGMARAVCDARGWYSIWDVVVEPAYQNRRVGSALLRRQLDLLRQQGPAGANVFLFTYQHDFYRKLGFNAQTCTMLKL